MQGDASLSYLRIYHALSQLASSPIRRFEIPGAREAKGVKGGDSGLNGLGVARLPGYPALVCLYPSRSDGRLLWTVAIVLSAIGHGCATKDRTLKR